MPVAGGTNPYSQSGKIKSNGGVGGLGGVIATAGWTGANSQDFFQLPQSGTQQMLNLESLVGNSGQSGIWQFLIDDEVVNTGGRQSADRLFFLNGRLEFSANLAFCAYGLADYEVRSKPGYPSNNEDPRSIDARVEMGANLKWLTPIDLPRLVPQPSGDSLFPIIGLCNGVYTNRNAAALVGRSSDSLFLTFRGTNDNASGLSPDILDWVPGVGMTAHFELFAPLIAALRHYVNAAGSGISHIYVAGHSLGASMVEALLDSWGDSRIEAVTFASPGYGTGLDEDKRNTNLWIDGDIILNAAPLQQNEGDDNTILWVPARGPRQPPRGRLA